MSPTGNEIADVLGDSAKKIGPALAEDFSGAYKNVLHDTADGLKGNAERVSQNEATTAKSFSDLKPEDPVHTVPGSSSDLEKAGTSAGKDAGGSASSETESLRSRLSALLDPKTEEADAEDSSRQDFEGRHEFGAGVQDRQKFAANYAKYDDDRAHIQEAIDYDDIAPKYAKIPMADLVAIRGYTGGDFYVEMNKALRDGDGAALSEYDGHIKTLTSGLSQLEPYRGQVTRGIGIDQGSMQSFLDRYKPGSDVTEPHFVSSGIGNDFMGNVRFTIDSQSGRPVKFVSQNPKENEVVFLPGSTFHVVSQQPSGPYGHHIHLQQTG